MTIKTDARTVWLVCLFVAATAQATSKHILFLGNSFTYHGSGQDLPTAFSNVVISAGQEAPVVAYNAPGGYYLSDHYYDSTSTAYIAQGGWDYVVLQEQSTLPASYGAGTYPMSWFVSDVSDLYDLVKASSPSAKVILYETWAWSESRIAQGNVGDSGPDAATMQARLSYAYHTCASSVIASGRPDILVAHVGDGREVNRTYANMNMFSDASHPNNAATLLEALIMYSTIYSNTPVGIGYTYGLSSGDAAYVQSVARHEASLPQPNPPWPVRVRLGNGQLKVSWTNAARATSYTVRRATASGGPYTNLVAGTTSTEFVDVGVTNGLTYYYTVSATNPAGAAPDSFAVSAAPGPDLQVYLPCNENTGATAYDTTAYARHATLNGGVSWTNGMNGSALKLDGSSGYANLPPGAVSFLYDFTICAWVNPNTLTAWQRVFDFGGGTQNYMFLSTANGSGFPRFAITTASGNGEYGINAPSALTAGQWTHLAVTLSNTTGILYVNGVGVATNSSIGVGANSSVTVAPFVLGNTTQNWIGRSQYGGDPYFNGRIDDFRIYDRALSRAEILALTNFPAAPLTGFQQTGAGPYDYNDTNNWAAGAINGNWSLALAIATSQEVTFAADTVLGTGLSFSYSGNGSLVLDASGVNRTLTLGGDIGMTPIAGSSASVTIGSSVPGRNLSVNLGGATRTVNVSTNTLTLANGVGNGTITKTGAGTLVLAGNSSCTGRLLASGGTLSVAGSVSSGNLISGNGMGTASLNLAGGSFLSVPELVIGDNDTGYSGNPTALNGAARMIGGSVAAANWLIVGRQGGVGVFNQAGGAVTNPATASGFVAVGWHYSGSGGSGNYTLSSNAVLVANSALNVSGIGATSIDIGESSGDSGTLALSNSAQVVAAQRVLLGHNAGATGTLVVNDNAAFMATNANGGVVVWSGSGNIAVNGGSFNANWLTLGQNSGSTGTVTQAGGTVTLATLWTTYQGVGTYNLNGGTLVVSNFNKGSGAGILNFNGGRLRAAGNWTLGGGNISTTQIRNNGAMIDTVSNSITISQPLMHSTIGGDDAIDGGLTKVGAGILTLAGPNTYTGDTVISNGILGVSSAFSGSGNFLVAGGATFSVTNVSAASAVISNLTLAAGGTLELQKVTSTVTPLLSAHDIVVAGNGIIRITGTNGLVAGQSYPLVTFTGALYGGLTNLHLQMPYGWRGTLATNAGQLVLAGVAVVSVTPPPLTLTTHGPGLQLGWAADHTGWRLEALTNSLCDGTGWFTLQGTDTTNLFSVPIPASTAAMFLRLSYP